MNTNKYQNYMNAFADLVAEALIITQACFVPRAQSGAENVESTLQHLREAYGTRIKSLGTREDNRDKVLENALGQYYGALVTQLIALAQKWKTLNEGGKNVLIDMDEQCNACSLEALTLARNYSDAANAYVALLWQWELNLRSRIELLVKQISSYCRGRNLFYKGNGGREVLGYSYRQNSRVQFTLCFGYHDGVDALSGSLNELLVETEDRQVVRRIAALTLGDMATLESDFETVEATKEAPPLVKISAS